MKRPGLVVVGSIGALWAWLFVPALSGDSSFVFRDAAHFYHPLFEFVRGEWGAGRVPLWNPYENLGVSLAGETSASLFYPGKLIFALPLPYALAYNLYIVGHVALAAVTSFALARHLATSVLAAGLAAVAYAFSGSVLFQYSNVVFLVGAAWLPLALMLADRMLRARSWRTAVGLGAVWALMITGGDPQMAYNAGLLAALDAIILWRSVSTFSPRLCRGIPRWWPTSRDAALPRSGPAAEPGAEHRSVGKARWTRHSTVLLAISATACFLFAAIQILPAWESARESGRAMVGSPRNVYELAASIAGDVDDRAADTPWYAGLLDTSPDGHQRQIYEFSVGPWRVIELVWPNVTGRQFPTHHRWLDVLPAEGRVWTPSLYLGLLPMVLAVAGFSVRRRAPVEIRWLSWTAILSAVASLGVYGCAWIAREVAGWLGLSVPGAIGDEVGGLYWLMTVLLPGYVYFRYPAKLLVVASLAMSMLAARGWDEAWQWPTLGLRRALIGLVIASVLGLVAVVICRPTLSTWLTATPADPLFGPVDAAGALGDIAAGLFQTAVVSAVLLALASRSVRAAVGQFAIAAGLMVTAVDLAVAQVWLVPYAPAEAWQFEPDVVKLLPGSSFKTAQRRGHSPRGFETTSGDRGLYRVYRDSRWQRESWQRTSASDRQLTAMRWDRQSLLPKYHLPYRVSLVEASGTLVSHDYQMLLAVARQRQHANLDGQPHDSVLDLLGARYAIWIGPTRSFPRHGRALADHDLTLEPRSSALPRAWIVHDVEVMSELPARSPWLAERRTQEVLFPNGRPRQWRSNAAVETSQEMGIALEPSADASRESCRITAADPRQVEIEAQLSSPGLVVLADAFATGWQLTVETDGVERDLPIVRTNRVMRGAMLPAGRHRLVYRYQPASVTWGAAISGASAIALTAIVAFTSRWPRDLPAVPEMNVERRDLPQI